MLVLSSYSTTFFLFDERLRMIAFVLIRSSTTIESFPRELTKSICLLQQVTYSLGINHLLPPSVLM